MKLYNTPAHQVEDFKPGRPPRVTFYSCGPTVYDYPHIGNWFTFIRYDILVRVLCASGYEPDWAMNITDVGHLVSDADEGEDKLEKGARREGKTAQEIADFYSDYFTKALERLNFRNPQHLPRATGYIDQMIDLIKQLESKGYTYQISDGIYYDTAKFSQYADFANLNLAEQSEGARVKVNEEKRNPPDFALWKFSPKDKQRDMEWDSPWGKGFPGWHIECSAIVKALFGDTVDIHAGGIDHIPVHHTNEVAQSQAASGQPLARLWFHANHILVDDQKIAKSAGNGITLEDVEAMGYKLVVLRLLVLQSHYRTQSTFSWDSLAAAANRLKKLQDFADLRFQPKDEAASLGEDFADKSTQFILTELADDLATPRALAALDNIIDGVNQIGAINPADVENFVKLLAFVDNVFGLELLGSGDLTDKQKKTMEERHLARASQSWTKADELRQTLKDEGIMVDDTELGQIWSRAS